MAQLASNGKPKTVSSDFIICVCRLLRAFSIAAYLVCLLTLKGLFAAIAAIVFLAIFPDLVFGSFGTRTANLKLATGPIPSLTCLMTSFNISSSDIPIPAHNTKKICN